MLEGQYIIIISVSDTSYTTQFQKLKNTVGKIPPVMMWFDQNTNTLYIRKELLKMLPSIQSFAPTD